MKTAIGYRFPSMGTRATLPALLAAFALGVSGCYTYVPVQPPVPEAGETVRADIDQEAASRLTSIFGPGVTQVQGMVLRHEDQAVSVLVNAYTASRAGLMSGFNEPVLLNYPEIQGMTVKRFSKQRSILFGAGFVTAAVLTATAFGDLNLFFTDEDPEGDPPTDMRTGRGIRLPLGFRIPLSIR